MYTVTGGLSPPSFSSSRAAVSDRGQATMTSSCRLNVVHRFYDFFSFHIHSVNKIKRRARSRLLRAWGSRRRRHGPPRRKTLSIILYQYSTYYGTIL